MYVMVTAQIVAPCVYMQNKSKKMQIEKQYNMCKLAKLFTDKRQPKVKKKKKKKSI